MWIVLLIFFACLTIYAFTLSDVVFIYISIILILVCIYRVFFRTTIMANKQYNQFAVMQGAAEWERITTFSDEIIISDGCSTTQYTYDRVTELVETKDYLALGIGSGLNRSFARLAKGGFGQNTDQDFIDFLKREHPSIIIRTNNTTRSLQSQ